MRVKWSLSWMSPPNEGWPAWTTSSYKLCTASTLTPDFEWWLFLVISLLTRNLGPLMKSKSLRRKTLAPLLICTTKSKWMVKMRTHCGNSSKGNNPVPWVFHLSNGTLQSFSLIGKGFPWNALAPKTTLLLSSQISPLRWNPSDRTMIGFCISLPKSWQDLLQTPILFQNEPPCVQTPEGDHGGDVGKCTDSTMKQGRMFDVFLCVCK